jgi:hypothetical protein
LHQSIKCNNIRCMRATLDIDDDILATAEMLAAGEGTTVGKVISDLARQALDRPLIISDLPLRNGIRVLPSRGGPPITNEIGPRTAGAEVLPRDWPLGDLTGSCQDWMR